MPKSRHQCEKLAVLVPAHACSVHVHHFSSRAHDAYRPRGGMAAPDRGASDACAPALSTADAGRHPDLSAMRAPPWRLPLGHPGASGEPPPVHRRGRTLGIGCAAARGRSCATLPNAQWPATAPFGHPASRHGRRSMMGLLSRIVDPKGASAAQPSITCSPRSPTGSWISSRLSSVMARWCPAAIRREARTRKGPHRRTFPREWALLGSNQ